MRFIRKLHMTLIEIMIVVSIILLVLGVIGLNIRKALVTQRFYTETDLLVDSMRLAQDLMLVLGKDVHFIVRGDRDGSGIEYWVEVEGGAPSQWDLVIKRSRRKLDSTHFISFDQKDTFLARPGLIDLRFQSKGSMMSKGELQLSTHEDPFSNAALRRSICLRGYPHAITSLPVVKVPAPGGDWISCDEDEEKEGYYEQLTLYTKEEILEDAPPKEDMEKQKDQTEDKPAETPDR